MQSYQGKHVLIIRFSSIGDIVLTSPIVRAVKEQLKAKVDFLTLAKNSSILEGNPYIDDIITYEEGVDLRKYALIIDLQKNRKSSMLRLKSNVKSISFDKQNINKWLLTNFKINRLPDKHLVDRYFEALAPLGIVNDFKGLDFFIQKGVTIQNELPKDYVVLNCGGTYFTKRIPLQKCEEIINASHKPVVLLGGNDVKEIGSNLERLPEVINLIGKTNLQESALIIQKCNYLITSDSALMHIGAAFQKNMAVIWGNTSKELGMYPYYAKNSTANWHNSVVKLNCNPCSKLGYAKCPKGHFKCMMDQKVEEIPFLN